jgi:hypothetical protein
MMESSLKLAWIILTLTLATENLLYAAEDSMSTLSEAAIPCTVVKVSKDQDVLTLSCSKAGNKIIVICHKTADDSDTPHTHKIKDKWMWDPSDGSAEAKSFFTILPSDYCKKK